MGLQWGGSKEAPMHNSPEQEPVTIQQIGGIVLDQLADHVRDISTTTRKVMEWLYRPEQDNSWPAQSNTPKLDNKVD